MAQWQTALIPRSNVERVVALCSAVLVFAIVPVGPFELWGGYTLTPHIQLNFSVYANPKTLLTDCSKDVLRKCPHPGVRLTPFIADCTSTNTGHTQDRSRLYPRCSHR